MPSGPPEPYWRRIKLRDPHEPVTNPLPHGEAPTSDEDLRVLEPGEVGYVEPGPGSLGDADADERINYPQDEQKQLRDHTPEFPGNVWHQDFRPLTTEPDDRPLHGPKRTHTVYDSQQDELILESGEDNNFVETTYPYASRIKLSSARRPGVMPRTAILHALAQNDGDEEIMDLINRFKKGDTAAGNELVQRNMGLIREIVNRRAYRFGESVWNQQDVEDFTQEAVIGMLNALLRYDGRAKLSTYIWAMADGYVLHEIDLKQRQRQREFFLEERALPVKEEHVEYAPAELRFEERGFDEVLRELQLSVDLDQLFLRLPEKLQPVVDWFKKYYQEGQSFVKISEEVGYHWNWVAERINQVVQWLQQQPEVYELTSMARRRRAHRRRHCGSGRSVKPAVG